MTCPNCGKLLEELDVEDNPDTPPYLCSLCSHGWWPAELTAEAKAAWDPTVNSFCGPDAEVIVGRARRDHEHANDRARGRQNQGGH